MLFQVTHTHTNETCPAGAPENLKRFGDWWQAIKNTAGVTVLAGYVSPMEHVFHIAVEADDYPTLARALGSHAPSVYCEDCVYSAEPSALAASIHNAQQAVNDSPGRPP